uniref:Secreted protein n=1 Tax=Kalanchoe fedtschenkoi TaxID=63787 RepID=A0A7N1A821_KALFE
MCQSLNLSVAVLFVSLCFLSKRLFSVHQSTIPTNRLFSITVIHQFTSPQIILSSSIASFCYSLVHLRHIYCSISSSIGSFLICTAHQSPPVHLLHHQHHPPTVSLLLHVYCSVRHLMIQLFMALIMN